MISNVISTPNGCDLGRLQQQAVAQGLPVVYVTGQGNPITQVTVFTTRSLTTPELTSLTSLAQSASVLPRVSRGVYNIYIDLVALTGNQKFNIWGDLSLGNPPKYLLDPGDSVDSLVALDWAVRFSGLGANAITDAKLRITAIYVRDNPTYLVNPSFDSSINVPGDQVAS